MASRSDNRQNYKLQVHSLALRLPLLDVSVVGDSVRDNDLSIRPPAEESGNGPISNQDTGMTIDSSSR